MTAAIYRLLKQLDDAKIHYYLQRHRPDTIDVTVTLVGKRIEISVFDDDHIEMSQFLGTEDVEDEKYLQDILRREMEYGEMPREYFARTTEKKNTDGIEK
ncbi:hypothetical protein [Agrobacterium sp. a22-2]|uniref:hypothetical protein n=1 Tax=Agrobacterium sp. a22-2 TaxID=2283840 RepID=UPI001FED5C95|nr:hypothetical protein [Agrobacterium sp. a22-2]